MYEGWVVFEGTKGLWKLGGAGKKIMGFTHL